MNTYFISGVAGFIGSHLAKRLLDTGNSVYGVDNFLTGSQKNIDTLISEYPDFHFFECDINDKTRTLSLILKMNATFDGIFHLACPASPKDFTSKNIDILKVCSVGLMNIFDAIVMTNACPFLLASTSEVYGDPTVSPQKETYLGNTSCTGGRSCYDEGKRFAESYTVNFCKKNNLDFRIARIFNTYGPNMRIDDGRVIPNFLSQIESGKLLTIYGDGTQTRSLCYIDDLVEGLINFMNIDQMDFDDSLSLLENGRIMNLGNPEEISILGITQVFEKILGKTLEKTFQPLSENDPLQRKPDITLAKKFIDFQPSISLEEGLKKILKKS